MSKNKKWLITATFLILVGCIIFAAVMMRLDWDFSKLSTSKYITKTYDIVEDFNDISIKADTADITFSLAEDGKCKVVCYDNEKIKYSVKALDGKLTVEAIDNKKWFDNIGINFENAKITVYLPRNELGNIFVRNSTGDIKLYDLTLNSAELSVSTGKISANDITCAGDFKAKVSTGETVLSNIKCENLISSGNTGDLTLKNVIASEEFSIERSTGDIKFKNCDANEIFIKTDTGDIDGSLLSSKVFVTKTDTGSVNVPKTSTGGKCEVITDTGDINIKVKQEF